MTTPPPPSSALISRVRFWRPSARTRIASAGSSVVRMRGWPVAEGQDRSRTSTARRGRRRDPRCSVGRPAAGSASPAPSPPERGPGISAAVPVDLRVTTISPSSSDSPSTAMRSSAPRPRTGRPCARSRRAPRCRRPGARACCVGTRAGGRLRLSWSTASSLLPDAHVARLTGARQPRHAPPRRARDAGEDAAILAWRPMARNSHQPAPSATTPARTRNVESPGDHSRERAGKPPGRVTGGRDGEYATSVARRNLLDAWALR